MEINDKKLQRTKRIVNFLISFVLAIFLILLSGRIIDDLDSTVSYPSRSGYVDKSIEDKVTAQDKAWDDRVEELRGARANILKMIDIAKENKSAEQESFDNWIKTRSTLGSPSQDPEVLKRLAKLDEYQRVVKEWTAQDDSLSSLVDGIYRERDQASTDRATYNNEVDDRYDSAVNSYDLQVFLIRLLFTAPILVLGIFFFIRYRRHKFSPLFMGFSLFSVYVFFVGLVPYLPSYGGYVRYTVGILLTIGLGYYAIKRLRDYSDKKRAELKSSTTDRAKNLEMETAEKAFNNHICPSCGKDFLLKSWEGLDNVDLRQVKALASNYCRFCGMQVIKKCNNCGQHNYAHLPHCINCGEKQK